MKFEVLQKGVVIDSKEFGEGSFKIGRAPSCDIQLNSPQVSKQHGLLIIKGNKAAVIDTGSSNGIFINGILIRKQRIDLGDEVVIADFSIRIADLSSRPITSKKPPVGRVVGNLALKAEGEAGLDEHPKQTPQEKLVELMDEKVLVPYFDLIQKVDWRFILGAILLIGFLIAVVTSAWPFIRWGQAINQQESLNRGHTILSQVVRENYRILTQGKDVTPLTVQAAEKEDGILNIAVVDPSNFSIRAPQKLYGRSINDTFLIESIKLVTESRQERVSLETDEEGVFALAQPIHLTAADSNERLIGAVVVAAYQIPNEVTAVFEPFVEVALFAIALALMAFFAISKAFSHPIARMQEALDGALKGENTPIVSESKMAELEGLATQINFAVSRLRQLGGGIAQPVKVDDTEAEDNTYVKTIEEFDTGTTDAILLLDREKKVKFVGKALEEMLSMRNQYALGQNISDACRDQSFAGTAIDLTDNAVQSLGEVQNATLDINGISRNIVGIPHKNSTGEVRFVLIVVKMGGDGK